jgi:hypothetical protein
MRVRIIHRTKIGRDGRLLNKGWVWQCDERYRWGGPFRTEGQAMEAGRKFIEKETAHALLPEVREQRP